MAFDFSSKKDKFSDDKIKRITLYRLTDILQKPAKEIVDSYFITITVEESVKELPEGKCCFKIECLVWMKKRAGITSFDRKTVPFVPAPLARA